MVGLLPSAVMHVSTRATLGGWERERMRSALRAGGPRLKAVFEITLSEVEARSLVHASDTLHWLLAKTGHGWSHAALDPVECARSADRLEVLYNEAREQLKTAKTAIVTMTDVDAALLRKFIATVNAVEPGAFAELVRELRQIAAALEPANGRPPKRGRRSPLAEPC